MSTRCALVVKESEYEYMVFYRHCDGDALKDELSGWLDNMILTSSDEISTYESMCASVEASYVLDVESLDISDVPGDVEYIYIVDVTAMTMEAYHVTNFMHATIRNLESYELLDKHSYKVEDVKLRDNTNKLRQLLNKCVVHFTYRKMNGEIRTAVGTCNNKYSEELKNYESKGVRKQPEGVITYWDLNSNGWRTLKEENLISIEKVESSDNFYGVDLKLL